MERENLFLLNTEDDDLTIERTEFVLRRESDALRAKRRELSEKFMSTLLKGVISVYTVLMIVFGCLGVACIGMTVTDYFETKTFSVIPFGIALLLFALTGVCAFINKTKNKASNEDEELDSVDRELGRLAEASKSELWVPYDAKAVDIYVTTSESDLTDPFSVDEVLLFEESGNLCMYYSGDVIAVPISDVEEVVKIDDEILFENWTKDASHDSAEYAEYQIVERKTKDDDEFYAMNGYYSIRFAHEGEPFEILVPLYEINAFLDVLKLEVTEA